MGKPLVNLDDILKSEYMSESVRKALMKQYGIKKDESEYDPHADYPEMTDWMVFEVNRLVSEFEEAKRNGTATMTDEEFTNSIVERTNEIVAERSRNMG